MALFQSVAKGNITCALNHVIKDLLRGTYSRCYDLEFSRTIALCTSLDPRFKHLGFLIPLPQKQFTALLVTEAVNQLRRVSVLEGPELSREDAEQDSSCYRCSLWDDFGTKHLSLELSSQ